MSKKNKKDKALVIAKQCDDFADWWERHTDELLGDNPPEGSSNVKTTKGGWV